MTLNTNLQGPVCARIRGVLKEQGLPEARIRVMVRTGDTTQQERTSMRDKPPHILVTTPESLYVCSPVVAGGGMLGNVRTVIVDEVHAMIGDKRGSHLSLSLSGWIICFAPGHPHRAQRHTEAGGTGRALPLRATST
jgi:ATP-dependent Lhr-like helicase